MEAASEPFGLSQQVSHADLAQRLNGLEVGASLTLIGIDEGSLRSRLESNLTCPLLVLDIDANPSVSVLIDRILDDLATLAASQWPNWRSIWRSEPFAPSRPRWRAAAARLAAAGRLPRFKRLAREIEIGHLLSVLPHLILVAEVDPVRQARAAATIATLEWCRQFAAVVFLLAELPPSFPPWPRILYRALTLEDAPTLPVAARIIGPTLDTPRGSWSERRLRQAIAADAELKDLFESEIVLQLDPPLGLRPRVDLVWQAGRVVVELDGLEHERDTTYAADRHRDFELMVAGYLVLRLTNAEVQLDLELALSKVRRVVDMRKALP